MCDIPDTGDVGPAVRRRYAIYGIPAGQGCGDVRYIGYRVAVSSTSDIGGRSVGSIRCTGYQDGPSTVRSSSRPVTPSTPYIACRWLSTVRFEVWSFSAICWLVSPDVAS